ncbi:MAG: cyclic pyranopterin monophosphate synthase MoaC [Actinobacteria bacterium]|nr:cyclic pyranopterin monophosphate synthase MoaC [Actinomycetota bacterium]
MKFTHLNEGGNAHMVDTSNRDVTLRTARTSAKVLISPLVIEEIRNQATPKGDVIATSRIAGIMAAKKTSELIPLCHPIQINKVEIDFEIRNDVVVIEAQVTTVDRTGVEMEALTAVAVAGLTLIDMIKSLDPRASITEIQLVSKSGGKNGDWTR